jgi:hypothetical protein
MKKLPLFIALALFAGLTFSSCRKDYTCTCTVTVIDTSVTFVTKISDSKKKIAEAECDGSEEAYQKISGMVLGSASCDLEKN